MDPIDFTRPEAFGQIKAGSGGALDGASEPSAKNLEGEQRLRRALGSLLRWSLYALFAWSAGAALLALALQRAQARPTALEWPPDWSLLLAHMQAPDLVAQIRELAGMTLEVVYLPVLAFAFFVWIPVPLRALMKRRDAASVAAPGVTLGDFELPLLIARALTFTCIAFTLIAAGVIAMAAWTFAQGDDPVKILHSNEARQPSKPLATNSSPPAQRDLDNEAPQ